MNKWIGSGYISRDINVKEIQTTSRETIKMAKFSVACQRKGKNAGADFINCVAYGKNAETLEKYFSKGKGIELSGHIQTGSYDKNGMKVYTTEVVIDELEFAKVRKADEQEEATPQEQPQQQTSTEQKVESDASSEGFMDVPDDDSLLNDLPFRK